MAYAVASNLPEGEAFLADFGEISSFKQCKVALEATLLDDFKNLS